MAHIFYILTHIAETLIPMFQWLGPWSYVILFTLVFMETGLVVFPWLPGGSLVSLTSSFIAVKPVLKMEIVIPVFFFAAFIGDSVNYYIGHRLSHWRWLKHQLEGPRMVEAGRFLDKYGFWAVAFGRFVPLIRSFIPLISGIMGYSFHCFTIGNMVGVASWVALGCGCGYFFGTIPFVRKHFSLFILLFVLAALAIAGLTFIIKLIRQKIIRKNRML